MRAAPALLGAALAGVVLAGCGDARFADRAILWVDHDDAPIPLPSEHPHALFGPGVRDELFLSADRYLALDFGREATNVNALDEVPDSSWWVDPRRVPAWGNARPRPLSNDEMMRGALADEPPPEPPFTVEKAKADGATLGFVVRDARGRKMMLKLDPPGWLGLATSTEVVASRLVWAGGWRVPKIWLVELRTSDLVRSPRATRRDDWGHTTPLDEAEFREILGRVPVTPDGTIPAAMSLWIDGALVGPYRYFGRRADDANDRVPHQDRRDLRGYSVMCAFINNIDTQELNTLDAYVGPRGRGHLLHYQQDVSGAFGSRGTAPTDYWMGDENYFATTRIVSSLATLGLRPRGWEGDRVLAARARELARWPALGYFDAEHFDARHWEPMLHNPAFDQATARDRYWGAKRVVALSARELRAAIATGRYDAPTAQRLFDVLWGRRQKIARAAFSDVTPLDWFRVDGDRLCFEDLWQVAELGAAAEYRARGGALEEAPRDGEGRCVQLPAARGYRVIELRVRRPGERRFSSPVRVHLVDRRIVGVQR